MFTGIIEEVGCLQQIRRETDMYQLSISASHILKDVHKGDSIAVNGICLTVTSYTADQFTVDVMPETLKATNLQSLAKGSRLNLERALSVNGRFGGHFVSGHVDGVGSITMRRPEANAVYFWIETSPDLMNYIMAKGSIAVDGISLTVVETQGDQFSVSIIPHTLSETILQTKESGDLVNLECDMLAKYMERIVERRNDSAKQGLTIERLVENGFA